MVVMCLTNVYNVLYRLEYNDKYGQQAKYDDGRKRREGVVHIGRQDAADDVVGLQPDDVDQTIGKDGDFHREHQKSGKQKDRKREHKARRIPPLLREVDGDKHIDDGQ